MPKILLFILFSWEEIIPTQVVGGDTTWYSRMLTLERLPGLNFTV